MSSALAISNTGPGNMPLGGADTSMPQTEAFNNAVNNSSGTGGSSTGGTSGSGTSGTTSGTGGLTVSGNTIDTGRYTITASNTYTRPTDGGQVSDGMLSIYDKQTNSYVDAYGDPHLYTSAGDRANFQADGLTLNLGDGTKVQINPTAETNGVSHINDVAVSKDGQTVVQSGFYGGTVSTGAVQQGGPSSSQGFDNPQDTVLSAGQDGSLGTLVGPTGTALSSTGSEQALDGMGGGYAAFGNSSPAAPQGAASPSAGGTTPSGTTPGGTTPGGTAPASAQETALIQQLIAMLQQQLGAAGGASSQAAASGAGAANTSSGAGGQAAPPSASQGGPNAGGQAASGAGQGGSGAGASPAAGSGAGSAGAGGTQELISLLQQLASEMQSGASGSDMASLIKQLIPLLQQQLSQGGGASGGTSTASLINQLIPALQGQSGAGAQSAAATPSSGGTVQGGMPASYNPSMGISGAEINAMLANANGTGPEVNYGAWDKAAANYAQTDGSPNTGGQVSGLNSQVGSGAA